jgi:hypothetical protein
LHSPRGPFATGAALLACALLLLAPAIARADAIDLLLPGEWYRVPNSLLRSVVPVPAPVGDPAAVITAWSGGAYDTVNDRLLVLGGGHGDYGGNEVYAFSLRTLTWSRIWGPSSLAVIQARWDGQACTETYDDGNPVSRHNYNAVQFLPAQNALLMFGGSMFRCGNGARDTWMLNLGTGAWQRRADPPYMYELGWCSAYDPSTGNVFLADPSGYYMHEYNPAANTWTLRTNSGAGYRKTGVLDTARRQFILVGDGQVLSFDVTAGGTYARRTIATTGPQNVVAAECPGLAFDPATNLIVGWVGGADVFTLDPATWVWTRRTPAATNAVIPTAPTGQGTYGRFRYVPSRNAFVVVNSIDEDVYVYRLGSGTPGPTDTVAPSTPSDLRPR